MPLLFFIIAIQDFLFIAALRLSIILLIMFLSVFINICIFKIDCFIKFADFVFSTDFNISKRVIKNIVSVIYLRTISIFSIFVLFFYLTL